MTETPPFDEGLGAFRRFAQSNGFSEELLWVFRDDVTNRRRDYWIRVPIARGNGELVRRYYDFGREQKLGVTFQILCRVNELSACFIWVPHDELDAEYAMQGPLKLVLPTNPISANTINSSIEWWLRLAINRANGSLPFAEPVPSRNDVEAVLRNAGHRMLSL